MMTTTQTKQSHSVQKLTSFNPNSEHFNFELWSKEVRQQMLIALQKRLIANRTKTSKLTR